MTQANRRRSTGEGFMDRRMQHRRIRFHPTSCHSGKLGAIAYALGVSTDTAKKRIYGPEAVNLQAAAVITALLLRGEVEDATSFEAPIGAAMLGPITEPMLDLQRSADESDGYEDVCQSAWVHEHTDESLALYIRKLASDLYHGSRLLAALKAEQAKRADK